MTSFIHLEVFTEEISMEIVLNKILPKIFSQNENKKFKIHYHNGKDELKKAIKNVIPSISRKPNTKILVLIDQDDKDCKDVKKEVLSIIENKCKCEYAVAIVCQELESWFLGDLLAVEKSFDRFKASQYKNKRDVADVDNMGTKPSEYFKMMIPEYKDRKGGIKLDASSRIAPNLSLDNNKSKSFNYTIEKIRRLTNT